MSAPSGAGAKPGRVGATLVRGRWVITGAHDPVVDDGAVVVEGSAVTAVMPWAEARAAHPDAAVVGSADLVVMPGLINAHHHSHAVTMIQHGHAERALEPYLLGFPWVRDQGRYLDALVCGARLLSGGVTSAIDLFTGGGTADRFASDLRDLASGYETAGVRATIAAGHTTRSFLVYGDGEDERFVAGLPEALQADARSLLPDFVMDEAEYFAVMADADADMASRRSIRLWFAVPGPEWVTDALLQSIAEQAEAADTSVQIHALESPTAKHFAHRAHGSGGILHLERLGALGPRMSLAHGVWLDEEEIAAVTRTGASVVHSPGSNLRLAAGIAPVPALCEAGALIGLGTDANTLDDDEDMLSEMRLALRLARTPGTGARALGARDVLAMATTDGARILRQEHRLGRLAPGFAADLVVLDAGRIVWPWVAPECDPVDLVLLRAQRRDVRTVMVDGAIVLADGTPTRLDLAAATRELAERVAAAAYPAEKAAAARRLLPRLEAWYRGWAVPAGEPFQAFNSRT